MSTIKLLLLTILFSGLSQGAFANIIVTPATGGTNICSNLAENGSAPAFTLLTPIVLTESAVGEYGNNSTGGWALNTVLVTLPVGWQFLTTAVPTLTFTGTDITGVSLGTFNANTLRFTVNGMGNASIDAITITGLQVQATSVTSANGSISIAVFGGSAAGLAGQNLGDLSLSPQPITGTRGVCIGGTTNLTDVSGGGAWSSSDVARATVGAGTGVVTGVAAGTVSINYTLAGCITSYSMNVNTAPGPISGTLAVCAGLTSQLSTTVTGGTWTSSTTTVATVTNVSNPRGLVGGNTAVVGTPSTTIISYSVSGCPAATATFTVNPRPVTIAGTTTLCSTGTTLLSSSPAGGTWSSTNTSVATVDVGGYTVHGVSGGTATISYILPTGCQRNTNVTVNVPGNISAAAAICGGSNLQLSTGTTSTGTWSSGTTTVATVSNGGNMFGVPTITTQGTSVISFAVGGCPTSSRTFTVNPTPAALSGPGSVCQGSSITLSSNIGGGVWSSSNTNRATVTGVGAIGTVTGASVTTNTVVIAYTLGSCAASRTITVNSLPAAITGNSILCTGTTTRLSDATAGGTWSSTSTTVATVITSGAGNGTVSGVSAGTAGIRYRLATGCERTATVTVNQSPSPITGTMNVCEGLVTNLSTNTPGGTWSSSNTGIATVGITSGDVGGVTPGNVVITYHDGTNACVATASVTINGTPSAISGVTTFCETATTTLSNTSAGGNWTSGNTAVVVINPATGVATGISGGTASITYDFGAACAAMTTVTVNPLPIVSAISGPVSVCLGGTVMLSDDTPGGVWSSSNVSTATVDASGMVSGVSVGAVDITYTVTNACGSRFAVNSMTVDSRTPDVSITSSVPGLTSCEGVPVTYTANPVNGGTSPIYEWRVNGVISSTSSTISYTPLNGDELIVRMTSNEACLAVPTGSDTVVLDVIAILTPAVRISSTIYGDTVCAGTLTQFTAVPTNGGTAPTYLWRVNGTTIGGGNPISYTPADGDVITAELTSSYQCAVPATVISNSVTMTVDITQTPTISITASANPSCAGAPVTFTVNTLYGGIAPFIRWSQNAINVATGPSYTIVPSNGDQFYAVLMSSSPCRTADSVFSNIIIETVDTAIVPIVNVITSRTSIAVGQKDTLIAIVTPAGLAPTYQWYLNGVAIPGATAAYYVVTGTAPGTGYYYCIVGNGNACNTTKISNLITISVNAVGVKEVAGGNFDLQLVPNPNSGTFNVEGAVPSNSGNITLEVTNMIGQVVYKSSTQVQNDKISQQVSLGHDMANGVYMLHVITNNEHKVIRFSLSR